ncbi:hypothetical protein FJ420_31075 [Mesorhizobium sp. B3-1-3]|uniref:hypothetical protein n=1 Tax=unclassified Mesorhizobium TaxID=325217 RepID=UPI0011269BE5|nr:MULTISPECIES: hypothetical protein [unclassified Mesorhizobium]TPI60962.1 hypothetical protein FJ420_31075 [Mesorhizobium sp. B3-1-3]TPI67968.1 hypothetical protein FJ424_08370 [Mesorhizobium sp. B3-1-8]
MGRPNSISIKDLNKVVPKAVASAVKKSSLKGFTAAPTFLPGHGIIGFVVRELDKQQLDASQAHSLSNEIATTIGQGAVPATLLLGPDIVVGFFPVDPI